MSISYIFIYSVIVFYNGVGEEQRNCYYKELI